jgi:molybdopterin converting factor small subunit
VPSGASVADLWRSVAGDHPELHRFAASISCAVNADFAPMSTVLRDGDEVAFLPPVSGGSGHR